MHQTMPLMPELPKATPPQVQRPLPIVWRIDPLPDFLVDHTLMGNDHSTRITDVISRWVQFVSGLWGWKNRATFALRYIAANGSISVYFIAEPHHPQDIDLLRQEALVLLRAHRLTGSTDEVGRDEALHCLSRKTLPSAALAEVRQLETRQLWSLAKSVQHNDQFRRDLPEIDAAELEKPRVIYPWWAPGGPFLLPMESLISQPVPVSLSVYLEPTELSPGEWKWFATMAREAQTKGEQNLQQLGAGASVRAVDPSAELAGRLYIANLRRLSAAPFLVTVHCAAADNRLDVVRCLAGAVQALVQEPPFDRPDQDDARLPSGSSVRFAGADNADETRMMHQYQRLQFGYVLGDGVLERVSYLADARGAATVFRLPISVRGGVPGIEVRQASPDFHPGPRRDVVPAGHLSLGNFVTGGCASMPVNDLTKHALITGFTGSGKTVTVLQLLHQLAVDHDVPFLVLESAKQEYRGLCGVDEFRNTLRVFTIGNDNAVPIRLNPFELLPGMRVEAHLSKLQTCFEAAIPPLGPSSSVISEALLRVYTRHGWSLGDVYPQSGKAARRFPVLSEFVSEIEKVLADRGYEGEVNSNLRAALVGRFKPLLIGSKGKMFNSNCSRPSISELFTVPAVLELNDLSIDDKALVVMFILTFLREFRERNCSRAGELVHVTVVEEAHNVLENVSSEGSGEGATSADTRYKAVEAFCSLLTEIRALGEGLIIADQSPQKLARDAVRNTNVQIAHQLRDGDDRDAIAKAMIMEEEQRDYLGKLRPGNAALFRTGLEKATFVQFPKYYPDGSDDLGGEDGVVGSGERHSLKVRFRGLGFDKHITDLQIRQRMQQIGALSEVLGHPDLPHAECSYCQSKCLHRDAIFPTIGYYEPGDRASQWYDLTDRTYREQQGVSHEQMWSEAIGIVVDAARASGVSDAGLDAHWCAFIHLWRRETDRRGFNEDPLDEECYELFCRFWRQTLANGAQSKAGSVLPHG